jgi:hypothetical protein
MLPPIVRIGRRQLQSQPGAYAHSPSGGALARSGEEDIIEFDVDAFIHNSHDPEADLTNPEGLAVANIVQEQSLPYASPHSAPDDRSDAARLQEKTDKQVKDCFLLSVILLMIITISLLVAFIRPLTAGDGSPDDGQPELIATILPSQAPTSIEGVVMSLLVEETNNAILSDSESPQSMAFQWLLDDDRLPQFNDEQVKQRFALATLYFATKGHDWEVNTNWLNYSVPGYLAEFFNPTDPLPTKCDKRGFYQHLWLDKNNLAGSLPNELFMLTSLRTMSIGFNALTGGIPSRVGLLQKLEGLAIFFTAGAGGTIPTEIGLLTSFEGNDHTGSIPSEFWQLRKLEYMKPGVNPQLTGTISTEIGTFLNLRWLVIAETLLSGKLFRRFVPAEPTPKHVCSFSLRYYTHRVGTTSISQTTCIAWQCIFGDPAH